MQVATNPKFLKNHFDSIYNKSINCKNSQNVPFGRWIGPLQISNDITSQLLLLYAINRWFIFQ